MSAEEPTPGPPKPTRFPPSVGGSALSLVAGMLLARHTVEAVHFGVSLPVGAWLVPVAMLGFVVVLLQILMMIRRRMGVVVDPSSIRRQWWVIGVAFVLGVGGGVAFALLEPRPI